MFWYIFLPPAIIYFVFWIMSIIVQPKYRIIEHYYFNRITYKVQKYDIFIGWVTVGEPATLLAAEFLVGQYMEKPQIRVLKTYKR